MYGWYIKFVPLKGPGNQGYKLGVIIECPLNGTIILTSWTVVSEEVNNDNDWLSVIQNINIFRENVDY